MVLGVTMFAIAGLCTTAVAGILLGATNDGTFAIGGIATLNARSGAALAVVAALAATILFSRGIQHLGRGHTRDTEGDVAGVRQQGDPVLTIERQARARLLDLRLQQLHREVDSLELRRAVALTSPDASLDASPVGLDGASERDLLVLPEGEGTSLSRRMNSDTS